VPAVRRLYDETSPGARFLLVYVREAHAADEWVMPDNAARGLELAQPTSGAARGRAAAQCVADFDLPLPTVVDHLEDRVMRTYGAWPDRIYVIAPDGRIAYQGGVGPFGFRPDEVRAFLRSAYGL
jgi:iodothyronine deiodinase-like protein